MKLLIIIVFCLMGEIMTAFGDTGLSSQEDRRSPNTEKVQIAPNCVRMPLGRILLVRKGSQYCAVKLTETWTGETKGDIFTNYESYYQGDGTGDFSNKNKNVEYAKGQLAERNSIMFGRIILYHTGPENKEIDCGRMKLFSLQNVIYFYHVGRPKKKDFLIDELAPTKWSDISQVNVFDPRLKWYRYDEKRKDMFIPIDQLWEDEEEKK